MLPSVWPEIILSLKQMTDSTSPFPLQSTWISSLCLQISCSDEEFQIIHQYQAYTKKWFRNISNLRFQAHSHQRELSAFQMPRERISSALSNLLRYPQRRKQLDYVSHLKFTISSTIIILLLCINGMQKFEHVNQQRGSQIHQIFSYFSKQTNIEKPK